LDTEQSKLIWVDPNGRRWSTRFEIPDAIALRDRYDVKDSKRIDAVLADPEQLLDFAVEFFRPQWTKHEDVITEVDFMVALTATETSLAEAHAAIVAGLINFFRRCGDVKRAAILERAVAAIAKANAYLVTKIHSAEVDAAIDKMLDKAGTEFDAAIQNFGATSSSSSASSGPGLESP
jgi:hypothetical protein